MFESSIPAASEGQPELPRLDDQTILLLARVSKGLQAQGCPERPPMDREFELASQIGLASAVRWHRCGKPVTGTGGSPVVDWALHSCPGRAKAKDALAGAYFRASWRVIDWFLKDLLSPMILWVQDLPASESHHHPHPYGLLDHSLEVALAALIHCAPKLLPKSSRDIMAPRSFDLPLRLVLVLSFVHDIGKAFVVEVKDEKTGETWDPLREPLVFFKARHDLSILDRTAFRFLPGRGLSGHEEKGRDLLPLIIHPRIWKEMGPEIRSAYEAYAGRYETASPARPAPLDYIADGVQRSDGTSAARFRAKGSTPGDYLRELTARAERIWLT